jgi:phage major head subunit gpT-like protein
MREPAENYCTACYDGDYRIDVTHPITEQVIESDQLPMFERA